MAVYPAQLIGREPLRIELVPDGSALFGLSDETSLDDIAHFGPAVGGEAIPLPAGPGLDRALAFVGLLDVPIDSDQAQTLLATDQTFRYITPRYRWNLAEDDGIRFAPCPGQMVVRFEDDVAEGDRDQVIDQEVRDPFPSFTFVQMAYGSDVVVLSDVGESRPRGEPFDALLAAAALTERDEVVWAEVDWLVVNPHMQAPPGIAAVQWNLAAINAPAGGVNGIGTTIAVLDGGFAASHPGLVLLGAVDAVNDGVPPRQSLMAHGTLCAGVVGGFRRPSMNPETSYIGLATRCDVAPVRVFAEAATVEAKVRHLAKGIDWAVSKAVDAISISLAGYPPTSLLTDAIAAAEAAGIPVVAGSGNTTPMPGVPVGAEPPAVTCKVRFPAAYDTVISVGAVSSTPWGGIERIGYRTWPHPKGWEWASNYGDGLDVVAPGVLVPSTDLPGLEGESQGDYITDFLGTSAATPHVAALAGLLRRDHPNLTPSQIRDMIFSTCRLVGYQPDVQRNGMPWNAEVGFGIIDVSTALSAQPTPHSQQTQYPEEGSQMPAQYGCSDVNPPAKSKPYYQKYAQCYRPLTDFLEDLKAPELAEMLTDFWNDRYLTAKHAGLPWQACILLGTGDLRAIAQAVDIENSSVPLIDADSVIGPIWVRGI